MVKNCKGKSQIKIAKRKNCIEKCIYSIACISSFFGGLVYAENRPEGFHKRQGEYPLRQEEGVGRNPSKSNQGLITDGTLGGVGDPNKTYQEILEELKELNRDLEKPGARADTYKKEREGYIWLRKIDISNAWGSDFSDLTDSAEILEKYRVYVDAKKVPLSYFVGEDEINEGLVFVLKNSGFKITPLTEETKNEEDTDVEPLYEIKSVKELERIRKIIEKKAVAIGGLETKVVKTGVILPEGGEGYETIAKLALTPDKHLYIRRDEKNPKIIYIALKDNIFRIGQADDNEATGQDDNGDLESVQGDRGGGTETGN